MRAFNVPVLRTTVVEAVDSTSVQQYGERSNPNDAPWANVHDARAIADAVLAQRAQRLPTVRIRIVCGDTTPSSRIAAALARDLSDRITIIEPQTGLSAEFFVERIEHTIDRGKIHEIVLGCEKVPAQPSPVFTFDAAGRGFNDGKFGVRGLDDTSLVFFTSDIEWPADGPELMEVLARRPIPGSRNWYLQDHSVAVRAGIPHGQTPADLWDENAEHGVS
ncbi:hypothetical protein [Planotetraspora phitsanulokensis]|uniref:Uncharacterized protein n=1 Tax=Planotetraspora phitsanulokensis TaxID=575192 RepID=A0A8J3XHR0_9ACTN|nr:hypothetical protein [Planotetraspora phitsanulokensis]GII42262.1 hypothetical protein Pph01_72650 [Planotetraspora phitsanulokensis]